jgi:glycosyltransferase involved in cell wall biosynthesis
VPAVSVIMPAYNVEPFIDAAIRSVRAQTWTDFELIVIDDGATDGTHRVAQRAADGDPRVIILRRQNGGLSAARNTGLRRSSAPVIALLDSDDLWGPAFLEKQMALLAADPSIDILTGNAWNLGGTHDGQPARPWPDTRPRPDLTGILADEQSVFVMSLFRRRVYEVIGGFDESLRTNEDYDFWLRAAIAGFQFARNDEPLAHYRRRDDSLSASDVRMLSGILRVYAKHRPAVLFSHPAIDILDLQIKRFEAELIAAEAKLAMENRDFTSAREHIDALRERRGGPVLGVARVMARWTPRLLWKAYQIRRGRTSHGTQAGP